MKVRSNVKEVICIRSSPEPETSASRALDDVKNENSPKNTDFSNKSDLTETSSFKNSTFPKNEEQVESSLQGVQAGGHASVVQPCEGKSQGDVAKNHLEIKDRSVKAIAAEDPHGSRAAAEEEVNICDICGDLGRENLLAVCNVCGIGAEHIYCMATKLDTVPAKWICQDCVTTGGKTKEDVIPKEDSLRLGSLCEKGSLVNNDMAGLVIKDKTSSRVSADEERQSSRKRKTVITLDEDCSVTKLVKTTALPIGSFGPARATMPDLRKRPGPQSPLICYTAGNNMMSSALNKPRINGMLPGYKHNGTYSVTAPRDNDPTMCYNPFNGPNRRPGSATPQFHIFPLPYGIWQGKFKLRRNGLVMNLCDGIQAHLSRAAAQNMSKLSPEFPREMVLEETPRLDVWSSQFAATRAAPKNIHIYFFAKDPERNDDGYKGTLQSMAMNNTCLVGNIGSFELLIFSSDSLEEGFQRWNGLPFLWGVFREPKPHSGNDATETSPNKARTTENVRIPQPPIESRLVNFFQRAGRTCRGRSNLLCNRTLGNKGGYNESMAAPNLELSLGLRGGEGGPSRNFFPKEPSSQISAYNNSRGEELSLSLSLSLAQPLPGRGQALRRSQPGTRGQEDAERSRVDVTLPLLDNLGRQ